MPAKGTVATCRGCGLSIAWNGERWVDDQGQADTAGFCAASKDPDPVHEPSRIHPKTGTDDRRPSDGGYWE
jgi:hypothetical protein